MNASKAVLHRWLAMYSSGRFEDWPEIVADDFILRFPYAPSGVPEALPAASAREALAGSRAGQVRFDWLDVVITATEDPELLVTTARSEAMLSSGGTYANRYVMLTTRYATASCPSTPSTSIRSRSWR